MPTIDTATRLCGVIGNPAGHSLSPLMHNAAYEAAGLNYVYLAFEITDVENCLRGMRTMPSFRGLSVTIPHKLAVMPHLDEIDSMARHVGSVNTIVNENGRLIGLTTDGPGTLKAFADAGAPLEGQHVLFAGTGGAVRAVAFAVAEMANPASVTILGRTSAKVETLIADLSANSSVPIHGGDLGNDLPAAMANAGVVIQGTSVGMAPESETTIIPARLLRPGQTVFDMVYRPHKTRLLRDAEAAGCQIIHGIDMLVNQAVLQFERWTDVPAPVDVMRRVTAEALEEAES